MRYTIISMFAWLLFLPVNAFPFDDILGVWETQNGESRVEIFRCQNKYCGKIVWLKFPVYAADDARGMAGLAKVDRENASPSRHTKPLLNLVILENLTYTGDNQWEEGSIYDPKNGKTYQCKMTLEGRQLHVRGFVGISLLGRTAVWRKI